MGKIVVEDSRAGSIIKEGMKVVVGNGERMRLWSEFFVDSNPLKIVFPRIYALASNKNGVIAGFGRWNENQWAWNVNLRKPSFNWEHEQQNSFLQVLDSIVLRIKIKDELVWGLCPSGIFKVGYFRRCLEEVNGVAHDNAKLLWKRIIPPKVELFSWQLFRGRVMVRDVLNHFGCAQGLSLKCPLCKGGSETVDHLFLLCPWSWDLWSRCMSFWR
ncbi:hypothetical protein Dsin_023868 [Dipteronia sinensis]|uniref:Reverse transcriptase zinc-binding domain-containing protein n=1 Tax=Dipteronia sinensis TaxID=43782 RepID=A0AAE0E167_9ROSI|nr:hypothetical protein Dsin_023868 [Dipteronia sinensis]